MKHVNLALAVAGILAAGNAAAFAPVWPADGDSATGVDPAGGVVLWHSGASASNISVQEAVVSTFCDTAQAVDVLEDVVGSTANFWAVACIGKATLSANLAGQRIIWNKRNEGGSGVGVQPVATSKAIGFMKPSTGAGNNCPVVTTTRAYVGGTVTANVWACGGYAVPASYNEADPTSDAVLRVPDLGTADIEADKFTFTENVSDSDFDLDGLRGAADPTDTVVNSVAGIVQADLGQLVFGVYGGLKMWQAIQAAQFPLGHPLFDQCNSAGNLYLKNFASTNPADPNEAITSLTANMNRERCMPSLASSAIRSIFGSGRQIRFANDFQAETAYQGGTFAAMTAVGTTDQTIMACRRVKGSGTQAQFNANLLGYPCDPTNDGSIDSLAPAAQSPLNTNIIENEASGDVDNCVDDYNDGSNVGGRNAGLATRWAIGFGSSERNTNLSLSFRYFKIDGYAPTLVNVHTGSYLDWAQQVLIRRASTSSGAAFDAFTALVPALSGPAAMGTLGRNHSFGRSGWLAVPSTTNPPTSELNFSTPINAFRKTNAAGTVPNTCAFPAAFRPAAGTDITVAPSNCSNDNNANDQNCYTP